jgi:hypothetical protein
VKNESTVAIRFATAHGMIWGEKRHNRIGNRCAAKRDATLDKAHVSPAAPGHTEQKQSRDTHP